VIAWAAAALGPGRLLVQLRDKERNDESLLGTARALRDATRESSARFIVNGSAAVAHAVLADGVHLPSAGSSAHEPLDSRVARARSLLGDGAFISTAAHDDDELRAAIEAGATAALVSPIFASPAKGPARGVAAIASARSLVDASRRAPALLVYALGGVTPETAASCYEAGADGVAVIRALYDALHDGESGVAAAVLALAGAAPRRP
jgi:thiamine-phosphate pyrophosphorylase